MNIVQFFAGKFCDLRLRIGARIGGSRNQGPAKDKREMKQMGHDHGYQIKIGVLLGVFVAVVVGVLQFEPIPQDPAFHDFADTRPLFGISNFGDSVSNLGFAVAGLWGLWFILAGPARERFSGTAEALPYLAFFAAVACVSIGSTYYHLEPTTERLFWDRVPITVSFMALFAALIADRIHSDAGNKVLLPLLVVLGLCSLLYWDWSEAQGRGDLRFYGLVQFYPIITLPLIIWLFPEGRLTTRRHLVWVIVWYGLAKAFEHFDDEVFFLLDGYTSGHSLKHIAATASAFVILHMIADRTAVHAADARQVNPPSGHPR